MNTFMHAIRSRYCGFEYDLRNEQDEVISNLVEGRNMFCVLPTGYGKSDCYMLPPLILDELDPENAPHIALIISPLRSLMQDQLKSAQDKGISCASITRREEMDPNIIRDIKAGKFSLIFSSPEVFTCSQEWSTVLKTDHYRRRLCLLAFDEVHCITEWGSDFRPSYKEISFLSSFLRCPILLAAATCTTEVFKDVLQTLHIQASNIQTISKLPDRTNIFLNFQCHSGLKFEKSISWYAEELKSEGVQARKCIIFANSINTVADIWLHLCDIVGDKVLTKCGTLIKMYHSGCTNETSKKVMNNFTLSETRCVVATVGFGMGINNRDVDIVINWGASKSILHLWQEIGRDGRRALSFFYPYLSSLQVKSTSKEMIEMCSKLRKDDKSCFRYCMLKNFVLPGMNDSELCALLNKPVCTEECEEVCKCVNCTCCSLCRSKCKCMFAPESRMYPC